MMMWEGPEEGVGGDDAVEESGAEEGGYDLEEGAELSTEEEGTGAEAAGEAGQPMVVQQAEVGSDPEGKGAAREGFWIGDWDFTSQWEEMHRQRERDGWRGWKEGQHERYRAQGHKGPPWHKEWMEWLEEDTAAWERKQKDREERY